MGGLGAEPRAQGDFSIKTTHFNSISAKYSYFRAITHQLFKIILNVLNRIKIAESSVFIFSKLFD